MDNLKIQRFADINLEDAFFKTLKEDYEEFSDWFKKKSDNNALVLYNTAGTIEGFLYCKFEQGPGDDTVPLLPNTQHMKVGTFKFNPQQTRRGDRYLKKIFDYALANDPKVDDIYVTVFGDKHQYLVSLFEKYGFKKYGTKPSKNGVEDVLLRDLSQKIGDVDKDYPFINTSDNKKYLLSIYPNFHTKLFPDSKLHNESNNIVKDISHSNSIHKIYICKMKGVLEFNRGDVVVIYRTNDNQGPAEHRSVATSLCVVEDVHTIHKYKDEDNFVDECIKFSVFTEKELRKIYREKQYIYVINFTYNAALPKRPNRKALADIAGLDRNDYWGVMRLSDKQFESIIDLSELDKKILF
ncbi:TPA: N-acetyltransferase [Vibrio parahaemolyticus]|uniref:N-acetyltransferase n=1 Tax=Vibrio TaxID=662 RepID=UPI00111E9F4D|nr:N-acetyltransferase [Vibrio parahaemolyticus]MCR9835035.1 N-acetyltransferase [Vibrio parahaemolyticus]TOO61464.1 N-acetyltransferase [Vibrio parahaemolyticus]HCE3311644.1 N-acetyltransferase [Vibrio parahaemolyticus]HCG5518644.1 N-acetyltransferase [Vibrio parahaemolyticus]HCG7950716.1 N-acetyltransferase [Vibrio parahaemolyticus]